MPIATKYYRLLAGVAATLVLLVAQRSSAHELAENRATMVLRDQNHVAITLYLNFSDVLHRTLAAEQSFAEFVLAFSALAPEQFAAQCDRVPLRQGATPDDVADAVRYLLGARSVTGQMIAVDGGEHLGVVRRDGTEPPPE